MMIFCELASAGYGTVAELMKFDTPELLDCLEHYEIKNAIQQYVMEKE